MSPAGRRTASSRAASSSALSSRIPAIVDVAIVGAGAAGLAAAKSAHHLGLSVAVLEAAARVGGRAYTERLSFGVPLDRGCHWLHSASINPLVAVADSYGIEYVRRSWQPRFHFGDSWASAAEVDELIAFYQRSFAAIAAAGDAGRDVAAASVLDTTHRWADAFDRWVAALTGVEPDRYSTLEHVRDHDTEENWPVRDGYGTLVARYGADVPVELATPVESIDATGPLLRMGTPRGTIEARTAVVTVSTGVLADERIRFEPPLPSWKLASIDALPMGKANKVVLAFDRDVFGTPDTTYVYPLSAGTEAIGFHVRPFGWNLAAGYVGGRLAEDLEEAGEAETMQLALEQLVAMFGSRLRSSITHGVCTAWEGDPNVRGAYSAARPGRADQRAALARAIDDRLFFAGEATSPDAFATAHGAYSSGIAAAREVARTLGRGG